MESIKVIKNIWLFCIYFLKLAHMLALICLVSNWVEMCEGKRALIWNLFFVCLDYEMHKGTNTSLEL